MHSRCRPARYAICVSLATCEALKLHVIYTSTITASNPNTMLVSLHILERPSTLDTPFEVVQVCAAALSASLCLARRPPQLPRKPCR